MATQLVTGATHDVGSALGSDTVETSVSPGVVSRRPADNPHLIKGTRSERDSNPRGGLPHQPHFQAVGSAVQGGAPKGTAYSESRR